MIKNLQDLAVQFVEQEFKAQVEFIKNRYEFGSEYDPKLIVNHKSTARQHEGGIIDGRPYIQVVLYEIEDYVGKVDEDVQFNEYDFIKNDPDIGNIKANWKRYLACIIAHELAHTVTFHSLPGLREHVASFYPHKVAKDWRRDHGLLWRAVYREIRVWIRSREFPVRMVYDSSKLKLTKTKAGQKIYVNFNVLNDDEWSVIHSYVKREGRIYAIKPVGLMETTFKDFKEIRKWLIGKT
jgi:hypothetical protein